MAKRHRIKQDLPLAARLAIFAENAKVDAAELPEGAAKEDLLKRAEDASRAIAFEQILKGGSDGGSQPSG